MTQPAKFRWFGRFMIVALACSVVTGCIKNEVLIKVKGDGTGNIVVTRIFARELVIVFQAQMEQMKQQMAAHGNSASPDIPDDPFYNEDALKREAGDYGPDVTFVKAQKCDKDGARGSIALYSFNDINDVFVNMKSLGPESHAANMAGGSRGDAHVAEKEDAFEFKLTKGPLNQLKVIAPSVPASEAAADSNSKQPDKNSPLDEMNQPAFGAESSGEMAQMMAGGNPFGFTGKETRGEVMQKMLKGMLMGLSIEVDGEDVKSNASYPNKTKPHRYTLMEMDMDKLMASPNFMKTLSGDKLSAPDGFFAVMAGCPGSIMETNKSVEITFKSSAESKPEAKTEPKPEVKK